MKRWAVIFVTLLSVTVVLTPMTQAADEIAGRAVSHTIKTEMMEVVTSRDIFLESPSLMH